MIKSPFYSEEESMFDEIHQVLHKYGYNEVLVMYTEIFNTESSNYFCSSSVISEGLIEYMRAVADDMEQTLHENSD